MEIDVKSLNLIFMGTPAISSYVFKAMILDGYHFVGLIAQPDKIGNRNGELIEPPTKKVAKEFNIPVFQPTKIRKEYEFVNELKPDLIITLAYGQIVPEGLLNIPKYGCLNLHGSLLPKYRGAAPIQYSLINNDKKTGMTLMKMVKEMDAGEIYSTYSIDIEDDDNNTTLFEKMAEAAKNLVLRDLPDYVNGKLKGVAQDESLVTFCPTIKSEQEKIDLSLSALEIHGWIRGLADKPGAYLFFNDKKIKIFKSFVNENESTGNTGEIIKADKSGLVLQCAKGTLLILELQKEGKKRMNYKDFINGNQGLLGQKFN